MEKRQLRASIEKHGDFMNISEFAEYLGINRETAKSKYLNGLPHLKNGNEKLYFKEDILNAIWDSLRVE